MPDDTSSGESLPSGSHSSAQPEPAARFQSYAEYLARLDRSSFQPRYRYGEEQLWLASFTEDGRYIKRYACILRDTRTPTNLSSVDVEGISPDTTVLSSSEFETLLQTTDENVPYRIVIAATNLSVPSRMIEDVLGLGLDLEPEIFDYAKSTVWPTGYVRQDEYPLAWFRDAPALRIGSNVLCILETTPERKSKTAIIFLRDNDMSVTLPRNSLGSTMFSSKRPSQMREKLNHNSDDRPLYYHKSLVERYIAEAVETKAQFGPGNFLYVCLAALLELHLSTAPTSVFHSRSLGIHQGLIRKHYSSLSGKTNELLPVNTYPDMGWSQLRVELDHQRHTLRWMTRFFKRHLDYRNKDLQAAFKEIRERFKLRLQDLEQVESQLRDQLASRGIDRSIRMAEMSIRESKRVMLLTALAFIFLPISLASSVYGTNVQQINGTGHSIRAFVITAFAMCASAVVLWAFIAGFQSRRVWLKKTLESDRSQEDQWKCSQAPDWDSFWADKKTTWDRGGSNPAFIDFLRAPSNPPISPSANPTPGAPEPGVYEHTEEVRLPVPVKEDGTRRKALVPGCGTGYDVALLASWGYDAYGLEISKHAVDEANAYLKHSRERMSEGEYSVKDEKVGQGSVRCLLGDYFDDAWVREAGGVEGFDLIYDHTFLCALPPSLRPRWAARTKSLLSPTGILVCMEFPTHKPASAGGPPWSLPPTVHVELLKRPGEELTYDHDGVVATTGRDESKDALVRIAHWTPKRSHTIVEGIVRCCVSVWRHKRKA